MGSHHHYEPWRSGSTTVRPRIVDPLPHFPRIDFDGNEIKVDSAGLIQFAARPRVTVVSSPPTDPGPSKVDIDPEIDYRYLSHQHKDDHMETIANVKALRKRVAATKTVEDGTVVKFTYDDLAYVALFVAGAWWTSATSASYRVNVKYTDAAFIELLGRAEDVQIATAWEAL